VVLEHCTVAWLDADHRCGARTPIPLVAFPPVTIFIFMVSVMGIIRSLVARSDTSAKYTKDTEKEPLDLDSSSYKLVKSHIR
jgi:hypothetical protein